MILFFVVLILFVAGLAYVGATYDPELYHIVGGIL